MVIRPGWAAFEWASLLGVAAGVSYGLYQLTTRQLSGSGRASVTLFYTSVFGFAVLSLVVAPFWTTPDLTGWGLMLIMGSVGALAHFLIISAFEYAPAPVLSPVSYMEMISAVAVPEPGAGSDVAGMRSRAVRDGSDWVLNGTKMFITNGVHGDLYFVGAKTDPDAKGSRGITIFAVEKGTPGFSVGRALNKTGWLCSDTAELIFEDVRIPAENVLGEVNRGFYSVMKNFQNERIVLGAMACAEAQTALDMTVDYVKQRKAFGGVLWDKQAVRCLT